VERTKLLVACAIALVAAVIVITITLLALNMRAPTSKVTDIVLSGEIACLPHKPTAGPQTLECAFGLKTDDSRYFALHNVPPPQAQTAVGTRVTVHGVLNTDIDNIYDIAGTINVTSLSP
jgi:hypothetical protein